MSPKGRTVYSTDPEPEPERKSPQKGVPAAQQTVYVEREREGRKGKTVTIISGLQHNPDMKKKLLKQLKGMCGAGGTVKGDTLEIQGDHCAKVMDRLRELGYQVKRKGGYRVSEK